MSQAYQNMCAGMYKVGHQWRRTAELFSLLFDTDELSILCLSRQTMVALDMDGKVRKPQFELDSEQVRYEHRFAPFNSVVTPPPVHYIQFKVLSVWTLFIQQALHVSFHSCPFSSTLLLLFSLLNYETL